MVIKSVIFDFDGVICESMDIKTRAFAHLFRNYPDDIVQKVVNFHLDNGGMSRFEKFRIIYRDFLQQELSDEEENRLGNEFSEFCYKEVVRCPYVAGVEDFLENNYKKYLLYIVTGTPEAEMNNIIDDRGLRKYFRGVYGAPSKKGELIIKILRENKLEPEEAVMIGDSTTDYEGAKQAGVKFIGRIAPDGYDPFKAADIEIENSIPDISSLEKLL